MLVNTSSISDKYIIHNISNKNIIGNNITIRLLVINKVRRTPHQ